MSSISDSGHLQKLVADAGKQKYPIVVNEGIHRIEIRSDGKQTTINLFVNDGILCRSLAEYSVAADAIRGQTLAEVAKKIKNHISEIGKNLNHRMIEKCHKCYDTIVSILGLRPESVRTDKLLSALKALANYVRDHGLGRSDVIDKNFTIRTLQQTLLEEPIETVGERLKISPEDLAKFDAYVLLCIDPENIEDRLATKPQYGPTSFSSRDADRLKWSKSIIQDISSTPDPNPNVAIFSAAGVKDPTTQKIVLRNLTRFYGLVEARH
ncbi:MAG: hypothetical protein LBB15_00465 [Puniceicoccales bacterium]|jgi:hypothetical protein|nr:hypothetical protein [Puniceicoccales bacterium]